MKNWFKRVVPRALIGILMTVMAFACIKHLTILSDVPEVMAATVSIAIYSWFRFSAWAIRILYQPGLDMQEMGKAAGISPTGASIVFTSLLIDTLASIGVMVLLYLHALSIFGNG